jgi:hypothetical protein
MSFPVLSCAAMPAPDATGDPMRSMIRAIDTGGGRAHGLARTSITSDLTS